VQVVTVLCELLGVRGVEAETISTGLEGWDGVLTFEILVTGAGMGVEAVLVGALEGILGKGCWKKL
jgi:hypothetical protein